MPDVSLYPLSCPFFHSFHLLFFMPAFLFSPSLSFYAPLCQTSPRLQTYAQLALISYPYAQLIHFSLFLPLPFPPPYVPLPYHFCPAYIISIFIMLPKISPIFSNIFKILCLYPMYMLSPVCENWVFRILLLGNRVCENRGFRIRVFDDRVCENPVFETPTNIAFLSSAFVKTRFLSFTFAETAFSHSRFASTSVFAFCVSSICLCCNCLYQNLVSFIYVSQNLLFPIRYRENLPCRICLCPIYFVSSKLHNFQQKQISH